MVELRKHNRFKTLATAKIKGISEGDTLLQDISITGCLVECTSYAGITVGKEYEMQIIPETASEIGTFELSADVKWMRTENYSCNIGFAIVRSPKGKLFQRYVDYLSWRYSQGSSMTGSGITEIPEQV